MAITSVISCSNHDDTEEPILHQNYVQGKLNNHDIAINDINANILIDRSDYQFSSGNQTDIPKWFDWEVKLIETKDSVITLHLHIDNLKRDNEVIYSPNDEDPIKTKSTCYATVKDLKNNTTAIYHPTHPNPISAQWKMFMLNVDKDVKNPTKLYTYQLEYSGRRWPGIEGVLDGTLTHDDSSKSPLKINIKFILY
ncbi:hypothetical protein EII14_08605 [Alloprevotella sp. OH1205_COT-284]|uniref:hypothetical protein n=1 Tax=Alloprevotella sp. OH1205_COT-284 TaxID=2491043 RepID=UPI000F5FB6D7|nr:hypothetical protein [Alloprevotella sp. OH1205_COT-284]RRD75406.1 hypothetical protein EII14_08605 [Alloprevotella sp. OH1205_COT-284]